MIMAKYSKQELKTTLLNTLAVQGIKVHGLDLKKKRGICVFTDDISQKAPD